MLTLTKGFKKPESGDKGSVFFPALEANFQQLNDHTHNGINSEKLTTTSSVVLTGTVLSASWVSVGGGVYRQILTLPSGLQYDQVVVAFKDTVNNSNAFLHIEKIDQNTYYAYCNDSTKAFTVVYTS